jgi:hypothetical protein
MSTDRDCLTRVRLVAALAVLALIVPACAGTLSDREAFEVALEEGGASEAGAFEAGTPTPGAGASASPVEASSGCPDVPTSVFAAQCGLSGCHGANSPANGLDLVSPNVRARLLGHRASGGPGVLIDPGGNSNASVLYLKLTSSPPFGARMPLAGAPLDDATMACVAAWIATPAATDSGAGTD